MRSFSHGEVGLIVRAAAVAVLGVVGSGCGHAAAGPSDGGSTELAPAPFDGISPDDCIAGEEGKQHGECEGLQFDLSVSPECLTQACGLIVDVHGAGMTGEMEDAHTSLSALVRGHGYLVLQPWAPGDPPTWQESHDAQVVALARRVIEVFSADARRVHVAGFSQGGFMTWRMLCHHPELFASFAPLSATAEEVIRLQTVQGEGCVGGQGTALAARPVYYVHGTADALVSFDGALDSVDTLQRDWELARRVTLSVGESYEVVRFSGAGPGLLEFMQHDLKTDFVDELFGAWQGHCFPGSDGPMGCNGGPHWGESVLSFFEAHPKR